MLKLSLTGLCSVLFLSSTVGLSQEIKTTLQDYSLRGPVKTSKTTVTVFADKPEDEITKVFNLSFNTAGYLTEGSFDIGKGTILGSAKYVYNDKNQIVEEIASDGEKSFTSSKNTYDENGYITEKRTFFSNGNLDQLITFIYNDKMEVVIKEVRADSEKNPDQILVKYMYRYNAQSKVFEITEDWRGHTVVSKFSYNAKGKISEEHYSTNRYDAGEGENYSVFNSYNDDGFLIGIVRKNVDGKILWQESFVYDHLERLTHHNQLNAMGKVISYTQYFEFDDNDNWTKSTTYDGKKIMQAEVREITYN